jgi:hypothetical protein
MAASSRPSITEFPKSLSGSKKSDIMKLVNQFGVDFLRLQFTDILGVNKNVEVPRSQFEKALEGEIMFDGSSIEGFVRIEESDMLLKPELDTFRVLPCSCAMDVLSGSRSLSRSPEALSAPCRNPPCHAGSRR